MAINAQQKIIDEILGDEFAQQALRELGAEQLPREAQERVLALTGENILKRVTLELLIALPESERDEFEELVGAGDAVRLHKFLETHIPDVDKFIFHHATTEYEATKTQIMTEREGV